MVHLGVPSQENLAIDSVGKFARQVSFRKGTSTECGGLRMLKWKLAALHARKASRLYSMVRMSSVIEEILLG
jgi:hypothetical protein